MFRNVFCHGVWCFLGCLLLCLPLSGGESSERSRRWLSAYGEMERGRRHWLVDEYGEAASGFRAAISGFEGLLRDHPSWRTDLVLFRLAYCRVKLGECEVQLSSFEGESDVLKLRELVRRERERSSRLAEELERLGASQAASQAGLREELSRLQGSYQALSGKYVRQSRDHAECKESLSRAEGELKQLRQVKGTFAEVLAERDELRERVSSLSSSLDRLRESERQSKVASLESRRWCDRALESERQGDGASAARYWQLGAGGGGNSLMCWTRSAYWYWQVGEREKFRESLSHLFTGLSDVRAFWAMLSRVCLSLGEKDRSLGLASMSVAVGGKEVDGLVSLGACLMGLGDRGLGEVYLRRALASAPAHGEALWCLSTLLSTYGPTRKAEALELYERALRSGLPRDGGLDAYFGLSTKNQSGK